MEESMSFNYAYVEIQIRMKSRLQGHRRINDL